MNIFTSIKNNIPNSITCLNLLCGTIACAYAMHSTETYGALSGYQMAFIFIALGAVFDFCDGLVARLLHAVSSLGKELDSLSDCVTFGVAPSMLIYAWLESTNPGCWTNFAAFIVAMFGALRLAKFNVSTDQATSFRGLPIPGNAIFWIGYVNSLYEGHFGIELTYVFIVVLSLIMICNWRMFSFKMKNFGLRTNYLRYLLIMAAIACVVLEGVSGLYHTIIIYCLLSIIYNFDKKHD